MWVPPHDSSSCPFLSADYGARCIPALHFLVVGCITWCGSVLPYAHSWNQVHEIIVRRGANVRLSVRPSACFIYWLRPGWSESGGSIPGGVGIFLFVTGSRPALGPTQPPIRWVPGALSPEVKRPGREADHSPPSSVEVKNAWRYTSTPNTSSWSGA
jgi:hypothetical protein